MTNFVTLFNSKYLTRGLVMYESLLNVMGEFNLYIIAFDDLAYEKLLELKLKNVMVISLNEFEDQELLNIKDTRTVGEYCWTCSSKSILYILENYGADVVTYIDADLYFFENPQCLIDELGNDNSVIITEHRYSEYCNQASTSGKYCVQFVTIKNDENGLNVLRWWKDRCLEWCYNRFEDGKFGDQKYLDSFTTLFSGVHELENLGGGVGPWNVNQNTYLVKNHKIYARSIGENNEYPVVFYHFHGFNYFDKGVVQLAPAIYIIPDTAVVYLYKTYIRMIEFVNKVYLRNDEKVDWNNEQHFRDDNMDELCREKNYWNYQLFV